MTRKLVHPAVTVGAAAAVAVMMTAAAAGSTPRASQAPPATTPIKHVVVIIGENHSFDNMFATYQPPGGQKIWNLLSEGIITKSGAPGPHFCLGAHLARREVSVMLRLLYTRLPTLQAIGDPIRQRSSFINGIRRLQCTF